MFSMMRSVAAAAVVGIAATASAAPAAEVTVARLPRGAFVPDAEVDSRGEIHVAYVRDDDVYYVKSDDDGRTFSPPLRVNSEERFAAGGRFRGPDLVIGKDDQVHVVWYNAGYRQKRPRSEWGVMYSRLAADGSRFEPDRNLNRRPSDNFSIAADREGNVAVVWMADGLFVQKSRDGGRTFAAAARLDADPCECCGSRALFADGVFYIAYREKANDIRDMWLVVQEKQDARPVRKLTSRTTWPINACPMTGNFLAASPNGLIAGWETKGRVHFGHLDAEGNLWPPGEVLAAERGKYPVALSAPDGTNLVAWKNGDALEWRSYDSQGAPAGPRGKRADAGSHRPAGVVTKRGGFLLFP